MKGFLRAGLAGPAVRARRDAEVTKRLNELFADGELAREQARTASALDAAGTDWSDERW